MKAQTWMEQSQKKIEKKAQTQASRSTTSPNFLRYSANFRAAIADQNWEYGTLKLLADTDKISPMYDPYARAVNRWCVFGADGWTLEQSNNLH